jgi:hypothetical protein
MVSVSVSRNSIAPLLVKEWPTIRATVSSEADALDGLGAVPCAESELVTNRKHRET